MGSDTKDGGRLSEGGLRFLLAFGAAVAAAVALAWAAQFHQDDLIRRNETSIMVINTRLDFICEKLTEIRSVLADTPEADMGE